METDTPTETRPTAPVRRASTPLGPCPIAAEVAVPDELRPDDHLVLQRLESPAGPLLRLGYRRGDRMIRGPISSTPAGVRALVGAALAEPSIAKLLRLPEK